MSFSIIVFDLDFTLWNAGGKWCDHTYPPYRKENNVVKDSLNSTIFLYPGVRDMLMELSQDFVLGVASRTHQPGWALDLLKLFDIRSFFKYLEIYPGSKTEHFYQIQEQSGIAFEKMLFFDDEMRNVDDVSQLDVTAVLVDKGITPELVNKHVF